MATIMAQSNSQKLLARLTSKHKMTDVAVDGKHALPTTRRAGCCGQEQEHCARVAKHSRSTQRSQKRLNRQEPGTILLSRFREKYNRGEERTCCADGHPRSTEGDDLRKAGARTLEDARKRLRAKMMLVRNHGGRLLKHSDFIIMWPDRYEPRQALLPSNPCDNKQVQFKRPRYAAWKVAIKQRKDGKQRMMDLTDYNDDTTRRGCQKLTSSTSGLVFQDEACYSDDFDGPTIFDMDDLGLELENEVEKAHKHHMKRLGSYAISHSHLCRLVVVLQDSLEQWDRWYYTQSRDYWRGTVFKTRLCLRKY